MGETLIDYISREGAQVIISDINEARMEEVAKKYGATPFVGTDIFDAEVDIYAPCALGATLNDDTVYRLKAQVIAGAANNQLADEATHGKVLRERNIVYAPDFLINAGGIINVYGELVKYGKEEALQRTENIYNTTLEILDYADKNNIIPQFAAMRVAENRIAARKKEMQGN